MEVEIYMEFNIVLKKDGTKNLYKQLYEQLKKKIMQDELAAHSRLPAIRTLAEKNGINPATVVKAYDLLERDELIYKKIGSGSYISPDLISSRNKEGMVESKGDENSLEMLDYGQVDLSNSINFASATPSPAFFPVDDFKYAIDSILNRDGGEAFTYQKSQGYYPLRESIKKYLEKISIKADIDNIQIVSGAQQAIDLLAKILVNYGDKVIVEKPTYTGALSAFRSREAVIKGISLREDGLDLDLLKKELKKGRVRFVYLMTSFQNPTGVSWSTAKKKEILELSQKYNFFIIEDDCLSELYFEGEMFSSLKSYDDSDRVIYIKSFAKIFMPGLRLAFTVLPDRLLSEMLAAKHATDISSAGLTQRAFDFYLREGLWKKHINNMRGLFYKRFSVMQQSIDQYMPKEVKEVYRPSGGLYFWLRLPRSYSSERLYKMALDRGVAFLPGSLFLSDREDTPGFRLSFAAVDENEIEVGIKKLAATIEEMVTYNKSQGYTPLV